MRTFQTLWQHSLPNGKPAVCFIARFCEDAIIVVEQYSKSFTCLERRDGTLRWQRKMRGRNAERANTISGATDGVLVLSESRSDGPWGFDFGIYRYAMDNGHWLGASHAARGWGRFVRCLDWVPDFTNELRQTAAFVGDGRIVTNTGRVIGARSGETIEQITVEEARELRLAHEDAEIKLMFRKQVELPSGDLLHAGLPSQPEAEGAYTHRPLQFFREDGGGNVKWVFDAEARGWDSPEGHLTFLTWKMSFPYLFLLRALEPSRDVTNPFQQRAVPYHLHAFDLDNGEVITTIPVGDGPLAMASLEAVDARGLLLSWQVEEKGPYELKLLSYE